MSKPIKQLIQKELTKRLEGVTSLAVVGFTGIGAIATRNIRGKLRAKDIRLMVVKNAIARQAFKGMGLAGAETMLDGPCALAYGADGAVTIVRELLALLNKGGSGEALLRVTGSLAFVAAARAAFLVARDNGDKNRGSFCRSRTTSATTKPGWPLRFNPSPSPVESRHPAYAGRPKRSQ